MLILRALPSNLYLHLFWAAVGNGGSFFIQDPEHSTERPQPHCPVQGLLTMDRDSSGVPTCCPSAMNIAPQASVVQDRFQEKFSDSFGGEAGPAGPCGVLFPFDPILVLVLNADSWLCSWELHLGVLRGPCGMPGIDLEWNVCKANALPAVLPLQPL